MSASWREKEPYKWLAKLLEVIEVDGLITAEALNIALHEMDDLNARIVELEASLAGVEPHLRPDPRVSYAQFIGVMGQVDKWLDGDEKALSQNPETRASLAREVALQAIEERDNRIADLGVALEDYQEDIDTLSAERAGAIEKGRELQAEVARLADALRDIALHPRCRPGPATSYKTAYGYGYRQGIADGHQRAARIAHGALLASKGSK